MGSEQKKADKRPWMESLFGLGRKDADGRQVRLEHRGKYTRASRTGGVAARVEGKVGPVNVTANTAKGVRVSTRVARGTHVALQNGRARLVGRWKSGPFAFNLSKSGVSSSVKTGIGSFNFIKPRYSSVKLAGVQFRGNTAIYIQLIYAAFALLVLLVQLAVMLIVWGFWLAVYLAWLAVWGLWLLYLAVMFLGEFIVGAVRQSRQK